MLLLPVGPTTGATEVLELSQLFLASGEFHLSRSSPPCSRLHDLALALGRGCPRFGGWAFGGEAFLSLFLFTFC